jgi:PhzF family phenazine biosynthesis protein
MKQYIVDAFTDQVFEGNQAAVCILDQWPSDKLMQNIAKENCFSETAFAVKEGHDYHLRWFTPEGEIDFCGHATLGASYVILNYYEKDKTEVTFTTQVGRLTVKRNDDLYEMDFPAYSLKKIEVTNEMQEAIGIPPLEAYIDRDLLLVLNDADAVRNLQPDQNKLEELEGLLVAVTAPAHQEGFDCISRVFAPKLGIPEDPVTGSTHCMITPYWCNRLGKLELSCFQASDRSGMLYTKLCGDRVKIAGKAVLFSKGTILEDRKYLG